MVSFFCHSTSNIFHLLAAICYHLSVICYLLSSNCYQLSAILRLLSAIRNSFCLVSAIYLSSLNLFLVTFSLQSTVLYLLHATAIYSTLFCHLSSVSPQETTGQSSQKYSSRGIVHSGLFKWWFVHSSLFKWWFL